MNLVTRLLGRAEAHPARTALIAPDGARASFAGLAERAAWLAGTWRRRGIGPGARVLVAMPLGIELYAAIAALWRLGAVIVFPEPALGLSGLRHAARIAEPEAFLAAGAYRLLGYALPELWRLAHLAPSLDGGPVFDQVAGVADDHPALMSFTSGSTGSPKAILRSHGFLAAQDRALAHLLAPQRDEEVDLVAFPVFVIVNLGLGVTSALPRWKLSRQDVVEGSVIARQIAEDRVTRALVPPVIAEAIARAGPMTLDALFTGGGPVFPDLLERLATTQPRTAVTAVYGSTEAEPIAHIRTADIAAADWQAMRGGRGLLAGRPVPEIRLRLEEDEILVTGEHVNKGYVDPAQDKTTKRVIDGEIWHRTGDAGRLDDAGRLWLLGRSSERVGSLYPFEVEAPARTWPGVSAAALGARDERPALAIQGDAAQLAEWRRRAALLGDIAVVPVKAIPFDRRHRSKVDARALARLIAQNGRP